MQSLPHRTRRRPGRDRSVMTIGQTLGAALVTLAFGYALCAALVALASLRSPGLQP